jgi:hypothetical protein
MADGEQSAQLVHLDLVAVGVGVAAAAWSACPGVHTLVAYVTDCRVDLVGAGVQGST